MRYLRWILLIVVFLLLLGLTIKNTDLVVLRYFLGWRWEAPLALVVFVFFVAGVILGLSAGMGWVYRLRRELVQTKRELRTRQAGADAMDAAPEPPPL
jgi:uncharacterized integral membrane protein